MALFWTSNCRENGSSIIWRAVQIEYWNRNNNSVVDIILFTWWTQFVQPFIWIQLVVFDCLFVCGHQTHFKIPHVGHNTVTSQKILFFLHRKQSTELWKKSGLYGVFSSEVYSNYGNGDSVSDTVNGLINLKVFHMQYRHLQDRHFPWPYVGQLK